MTAELSEIILHDEHVQAALRAGIPPKGRRAEYLAHLDELAAGLEVRVTLFWPGSRTHNLDTGKTGRFSFHGQANLTHRAIETPVPLTRWHYLLGLHELGHVADPEYSEYGAWAWALKHSRFPILKHEQVLILHLRGIRKLESAREELAWTLGWAVIGDALPLPEAGEVRRPAD